jgi:hypothetical protein
MSLEPDDVHAAVLRRLQATVADLAGDYAQLLAQLEAAHAENVRLRGALEECIALASEYPAWGLLRADLERIRRAAGGGGP